MMNRRKFLYGAAGLGAVGLAATMYQGTGFSEVISGKKLQMPPLLDATQSGRFELQAMAGSTDFTGRGSAPTIGFNQSYLGPTVRVKKGAVSARISNAINEPVTVHWHGMLIPGEQDGGPHQPIGSGESWSPELTITQPPATIWYHTHIHGRTATQVHAGLAGIMQISDGRDGDRGIPNSYGVDDLTLVLQDRRFDENGQMIYMQNMMDVMHGFTGDTMVINGQVGSVASVPKGIVRLRLINGSNARIYSLRMSDNREMHLIATDGGYLTAPIALTQVQLAPGERIEILVDFSSGGDVSLVSGEDPNQGPGGMMGRFQQLRNFFSSSEFTIIPFVVDERIASTHNKVPEALDGRELTMAGAISTTRHLSLDMGMGPGMMMRGMMGGGMSDQMAINGQSFDMNRINIEAKRGAVERWIIRSDTLAHPFHIHGALFQVVKENGQEPRPEHLGWKDTVLVEQEIELLVRFDHKASREKPFMYHCHILEHEDAGMMGQFIVS
ncbi:MAG: multicopper oxidase domain-containing protein [Rhizobiaceae bacterium]|nr:multicopper oxidase domain-containing protein [Rhizobiaceae bacterium]